MQNSKDLLIIQAGHAPDDIRSSLGDISDWYFRALGDPGIPVQVVRPFLGEALPPASELAAAVITGSWAMVSDQAPWSEGVAGWIRDEAMSSGLPLFGVCFGHQLMSHALGGRVDYHPKGAEIGVCAVTVLPEGQADPALKFVPAEFDAPLTHLQSVLELPPGAVALAASAHDPHQIVRYGPHALSVQFHPEFDEPIMSACIERRADSLAAEGFDVPVLLEGVKETAVAREILLDFVRQAIALSRIAA